MSAWDRQEKEPPKAYSYFCIYRDLGPQERSLPKVCQLSAISLPRAKTLSEDYGWVGRCDQWDAHLQSTFDRAFVTEAAKRGKQRGQAFTALLAKSLAALQKTKVEGVALKDVAAAMKIATEGLRLEEGLETKRVSMEVTDVRTILARLPAEVRKPLLLALAQHAGQSVNQRDPIGIPERVESDDDTDD